MKRTLLCLIAGLAPLFSALTAHAAGCEHFFQKWGRQLHPGREILIDNSTDGSNRGAICKVWPANETLTLAVLPVLAGSRGEEETFDLDVLVANTVSGKIIAHTFEKAAIIDSAIEFSGLSLDTARYQLTPDKRAFGVRFTYESAADLSPVKYTTLNLYMIDGQRMYKALNQLAVQNLTGDWDSDVCRGSFTNVTRTLDIGPRGKDGYAALKVTEKTVNTVNTAKGNSCIRKEKSGRHSTTTLEYHNDQYYVPKKMRAIYD